MDIVLYHIQQNIDSIKQTRNNVDFWSARDLMIVLGYREWRKFEGVIQKAKDSCKTGGELIHNHFVGADKMVLTGSGAKRFALGLA